MEDRCFRNSLAKESDQAGIPAEVLELAKDPAIASLADQIVAMEKELKEMFEPGKLMPGVGRVGRLVQCA